LLKGLRESRGISIIFISHDIDLVAEISDRIMVMYGGLVMGSGPVGLFRIPDFAGAAGKGPVEKAPAGRSADTGRAAHPYTQALLAASPRFGSHYSLSRLLTIPGRVVDPAAPPPGCPFAPRCPRARPECSGEIPALRVREDREIRCVNSGLDRLPS
jgi:peptide/nickel transport system permease protein